MTASVCAVAIDASGCVVSVVPMGPGVCAADIAHLAARWRALGYRVAALPFEPTPGVVVSEPLRREVASDA